MNNENSFEDLLDSRKKVITKFLKLIREKYPVADKANYFLERLGINGISIAVVNQRDALSHLSTLLSDPDLTEDEQMGQYYAAEEHLRRAVLESYQMALSIKLLSIGELYEKYRNVAIPHQKCHPLLGSAPDISMITTTLREIETLGQNGRSTKARNKWDDEWEKGVKHYVEAVRKAEELEDNLKNYLGIASQIPQSITKKETVLLSVAIISIILNIIALIIFVVR